MNTTIEKRNNETEIISELNQPVFLAKLNNEINDLIIEKIKENDKYNKILTTYSHKIEPVATKKGKITGIHINYFVPLFLKHSHKTKNSRTMRSYSKYIKSQHNRTLRKRNIERKILNLSPINEG